MTSSLTPAKRTTSRAIPDTHIGIRKLLFESFCAIERRKIRYRSLTVIRAVPPTRISRESKLHKYPDIAHGILVRFCREWSTLSIVTLASVWRSANIDAHRIVKLDAVHIRVIEIRTNKDTISGILPATNRVASQWIPLSPSLIHRVISIGARADILRQYDTPAIPVPLWKSSRIGRNIILQEHSERVIGRQIGSDETLASNDRRIFQAVAPIRITGSQVSLVVNIGIVIRRSKLRNRDIIRGHNLGKCVNSFHPATSRTAFAVRLQQVNLVLHIDCSKLGRAHQVIDRIGRLKPVESSLQAGIDYAVHRECTGVSLVHNLARNFLGLRVAIIQPEIIWILSIETKVKVLEWEAVKNRRIRFLRRRSTRRSQDRGNAAQTDASSNLIILIRHSSTRRNSRPKIPTVFKLRVTSKHLQCIETSNSIALHAGVAIILGKHRNSPSRLSHRLLGILADLQHCTNKRAQIGIVRHRRRNAVGIAQDFHRICLRRNRNLHPQAVSNFVHDILVHLENPSIEAMDTRIGIHRHQTVENIELPAVGERPRESIGHRRVYSGDYLPLVLPRSTVGFIEYTRAAMLASGIVNLVVITVITRVIDIKRAILVTDSIQTKILNTFRESLVVRLHISSATGRIRTGNRAQSLTRKRTLESRIGNRLIERYRGSIDGTRNRKLLGRVAPKGKLHPYCSIGRKFITFLVEQRLVKRQFPHIAVNSKGYPRLAELPSTAHHKHARLGYERIVAVQVLQDIIPGERRIDKGIRQGNRNLELLTVLRIDWGRKIDKSLLQHGSTIDMAVQSIARAEIIE